MTFRIDNLGRLLHHAGLASGVERGRPRPIPGVEVGGRRARENDPLPEVGDAVRIRGYTYRTVEGGGGRLQLVADPSETPERIEGPVRVHAGYHKCLTMYARAVYSSACGFPAWPGSTFRHFFHRADAFYRECGRHTVASVSGHALQLDRFDDVRVVRFIRDPRDLLVSGYFYHRRGAEHWGDLPDPADADWAMVGGAVPRGIPPGRSFREHLQTVPKEEGLLCEIEFRRPHFESMLAWPEGDDRVLLMRYEEILGDELRAFERALRFLGLPWLARKVGEMQARRLAASRRATKTDHIRDPRSGQWREHFTPVVRRRFQEAYSDLVARLGYPEA